jgi:oligopeptide/dipeptide ABC transporter ATP-binding protein
MHTLSKSRLPTIEGAVPGLNAMPVGCRYQNRCPYAQPRCADGKPPLEPVGADHAVACIRWRELPPYQTFASASA